MCLPHPSADSSPTPSCTKNRSLVHRRAAWRKARKIVTTGTELTRPASASGARCLALDEIENRQLHGPADQLQGRLEIGLPRRQVRNRVNEIGVDFIRQSSL